MIRRALADEGLRSADLLKRRMAADFATDGVTGDVRFDSAGNPRLRARLATIADGRFREVE